MKTAFACLALLAAIAALILADRSFPHILSPQTYSLLLLACGISLLIHGSRLVRGGKFRHQQSG